MSRVLWARLLLIVVCALSVCFVTTVNRAVGQLLSISWIPDTCIASTLACLGLYLAIRPARPFRLPLQSTNWRRVRRLSVTWLAVWLVASGIGALVAGHWIHYRLASTVPQIVGFLVLGPFQEELLFRGVIFELAERSTLGGAWFPVLVSTVFFSLHHLQLHGYVLTSAALSQIAFAIPMGLVFGALRAETESLWPSFVVHVLTNLPGAIGRSSVSVPDSLHP